jgi:GntR family transcriptional regulator/MocR family aminotransferase
MMLLNLAASNGAWIIEDDYDSEFRFGSRPIASLQGLYMDERVIYVGTFAKSMFPAMRLAFLIVPLDLVPHVHAMRRAADLHPPVLEQLALADFIRDGHYAAHLRRMRAVYRERRRRWWMRCKARWANFAKSSEGKDALVALLRVG